MNPYEILNVPNNATDEEIKSSYREKAKSSHPDAGGKEEDFASLSNAYALLKDPIRRKHFDEFGQDKPNEISIETKASILLNDMVMQMLSQISDPNDIIYEDVIRTMTKAVNTQIKNVDEQIKTIKRERIKLKKLKKIFKQRLKQKNPSNNFIEHGINQQLTLMDNQLSILKNQKEIFCCTIDNLKNFTFTTDKKPEPEQNEAYNDFRKMQDDLVRRAAAASRNPSWFQTW